MFKTSAADKETDSRPLMVLGCIVLLLLFIAYLSGGEDSVAKNVRMWGVYTGTTIQNWDEVPRILAGTSSPTEVSKKTFWDLKFEFFAIKAEDDSGILMKDRVFKSGQLIRMKPDGGFDLLFTMLDASHKQITSRKGNETIFSILETGIYFVQVEENDNGRVAGISEPIVLEIRIE
jgi:hypothetical protein